MAYEKQTFIDGVTVLTSDHLEHIEYGLIAADTCCSLLDEKIETLENNLFSEDGSIPILNSKVETLENDIGDIDATLDSILEIQNRLIGGDDA